MKMKFKLIFFIFIILTVILITSCQNIKFIKIKHDNKGNQIEKIDYSKDGWLDWSQGKQISFEAHGL